MAAKAGPVKVGITLYKGIPFRHKIKVVDEAGAARNLTGYTAKMHIRADIDDSVALLELTPTVNPALGEVDILITEVQTASLTAQSAVWDLVIDTSGSDAAELLAYGGVTIRSTVTR